MRRERGAQKRRLWERRHAPISVAVVAAAVVMIASWHFRDHLPRWPESGVAPVQRVIVEGPFELVSTTEVEIAVLPYLTGGFFTVDLDAIRDAAESLPWVRTAQVVREWPDRVRIQVAEEHPVLRWGESGLINRDGELFITGVESPPEGLPRLDGPNGTERAMVNEWLVLDGRLGECAGRVTRLEQDARRAIQATLENGLVLRFGRSELDARVERFCEVATTVLAARFEDIAYLDMRYTNGFAVGWRKGG